MLFRIKVSDLDVGALSNRSSHYSTSSYPKNPEAFVAKTIDDIFSDDGFGEFNLKLLAVGIQLLLIRRFELKVFNLELLFLEFLIRIILKLQHIMSVGHLAVELTHKLQIALA